MEKLTRAFLLSLIVVLLLPFMASAQKNMVWGYGQYGTNTVYDTYGGVDLFYTRAINSHVDVTGGLDLMSKKGGFGGVLAEVRYRIPVKGINVFVSGRGVYNYYGHSRMNEYLFRIALHAQSQYFDVVFGNSFLGYSSFGSSVFEPITWSVGFAANIKKRSSKWNFGAFIRNYDYFIYENWNINFGFRGWYDISDQLRLTGEFMTRPAGSMNQLAMKYDTSIKIGVNYKW